MRALFFGTPEIAVPSLKALTEVAEVAAVVCQPDRPAGRGMTLRCCAVRDAAKALGLPVHTPTKVRTPAFAAWVRDQNVDVAVVIAYGRILPEPVLAAPRRGCMNLHASILPKYRGAAPITWSVVHAERETGVCLMQMDVGMDTGPVYLCSRIPVQPDETAGDLCMRLGDVAAEIVRRDLVRAVAGEIEAVPQDESQASYAPILQKNDGQIDFRKPAKVVHDHVRGMSPWPGAFTTVRGKTLKVHRTRVHSSDTPAAPGTVVIADASALIVACGSGTLEILSLQLEGRKTLSAREMVAGRGVMRLDVLGVE